MAWQLQNDVITGVYATARSDDAWRPLLDRICSELHVQSAVVQLLDPGRTSLKALWTERDTHSRTHAAAHDRWINNPDNPRLRRRPLRSPPPPVGSDRRFFDGDAALLDQLNEDLSRVGLGHAFWTGFALPNGHRFSLVMHRKAGDLRDIDTDEEAFLMNLLPHLEQAGLLSTQMREGSTRARQMQAVIETTGTAVIVCDAEQRVQWMNTQAERLLAANRHLSIQTGKLNCHVSADAARLRAQIQAVDQGARAESVIAIGSVGHGPVHLRITALMNGSTAQPGAEALAIVLTEPEATRRLNPDDLVDLFGLTRAEGGLAAALATGLSLAEVAAARRITIGTARFQLRQVLAKTGTSRQAELLQHLHASSAKR